MCLCVSLLQGAYERAKKLLTNHLHELHALANELVEKETLTGDQIKSLITDVNNKGGRRAPQVQQAVQATKEAAAAAAQAATAGVAAPAS